MKKAFKSLLLAGTTGLMALTLASCGGETRNSSVPYGEANKYNSDTVIATASNDITNESMKMTLAQFYSRLRYSGNNFVTNNIKIKNQIEAINITVKENAEKTGCTERTD